MTVRIITCDCREVLPTLPADSFDCVVTSPPYYGLRSYLPDGHPDKLAEIGLEPTLALYLETMVGVCRELRRVLKPSGTFWLNVGSSYANGGIGGGNSSKSTLGGASNRSRQGDGRRVNAASDDKNPIRFPQPSHAQPYDSDGKARSNSQAIGSFCHGLDDAVQDGSLIRRGHTPGNDQSTPRIASHGEPTGRDSGHQDCEPGLDPSFRLPKGLSSLRNALDASYREATALACPRRQPQYSCDEPQKTARVFDKKMTASRSASHTLDMGASGMACDCGSCGICFVYLATRTLKFKAKDLILAPDLLALALQADGWFLRSEIIWSKPNPMPESVRDRPTCAHEKVWLLTKSAKYYFDADAIREPLARTWDDSNGGSLSHGVGSKERVAQRGKSGSHSGEYPKPNPLGANSRNVWSIASEPYRGAHYAVMPSTLAERCIKAGSPAGGSILDPFFGAGTTGLVADRLGRHCTGIELNPSNVEMGKDRVVQDGPLFADVDSGVAL